MDFARSLKTISREGFCEQLRRILAEQCPDETLEKLSIASDQEHTLLRAYARGTAGRGACRCAFLALPEGETPDAIESSLTCALLWLDRARKAGSDGNISFCGRFCRKEKRRCSRTGSLRLMRGSRFKSTSSMGCANRWNA